MKEYPILFNSEMVGAILAGRKTQTRRVLKPQPQLCRSTVFQHYRWKGVSRGKEIETILPYCPYGIAGDRLWVRETIDLSAATFSDGLDPHIAIYRADGENTVRLTWVWKKTYLSSIHLPRGLSRILLDVTNVRVKRVQDISEDDARAEGITDGGCLTCGESEPCGCDDPKPAPVEGFVRLWNSINEKRGYGWNVNPWVWVVEFKVITSAK